MNYDGAFVVGMALPFSIPVIPFLLAINHSFSAN
jgi:hypothetical protein